MAWKHELTPEFVQKYSELYTALADRDGMILAHMAAFLGFAPAGSYTHIIAQLEALDMPVWYEPETRKYRVMKYEDELMEVVR